MTIEVQTTGAIHATSAPDADALLRRHPRWRGADLGYTIALPDGRSIWLLADGFVGPEGATRAESVFVNNTVGVQHGADPRTATLDMYWHENADGRPIAYFRDPDPAYWFWPGHGAVVGEALIIFFARVTGKPGNAPWNFRHDGWRARVIDDWRVSPDAWQPREATLPAEAERILEGSGAVLVHEDKLYFYGYGPAGTVLTRWPAEDAATGNLTRPEWWDGARWTHELGSAAPAPLMRTQPEFSVHWEPRLDAFLQIECAGMLHGRLVARTSPRLEGPWSEPWPVFTPPESSEEGRFLYAGKAHPQFVGADLWATYVVNDQDPRKMVADESIYYPRFVQLTFGDPA